MDTRTDPQMLTEVATMFQKVIDSGLIYTDLHAGNIVIHPLTNHPMLIDQESFTAELPTRFKIPSLYKQYMVREFSEFLLMFLLKDHDIMAGMLQDLDNQVSLQKLFALPQQYTSLKERLNKMRKGEIALDIYHDYLPYAVKGLFTQRAEETPRLSKPPQVVIDFIEKGLNILYTPKTLTGLIDGLQKHIYARAQRSPQ